MALAPSTPVLDNFQRANGAIGSLWTKGNSGVAPPTIVSDKMSGVASGNSTAAWASTPAFVEAQECWATGYANLGEVDLYLQATLPNSTTSNGYKLILDSAGVRLAIWTLVGGFVTTNVSGNITVASVTGTWIQRVGTSLIAYTLSGGVWTQKFSGVDTTYTAGGFIGADTSSGATPVTIGTFGGGVFIPPKIGLPRMSPISAGAR